MRVAQIDSILFLLLVFGTTDNVQAFPPPADKEKSSPKTDLYGDPLPEGAVARMGTIRLRGAFEGLAFSPDGKTILSTDRLSIRRWQIADGKPLPRTSLQLKEEGRPPLFYSCVLTRDGTVLAALTPNAIYVWDAKTGEQRFRISARVVGPFSLAISEDGKLLAHYFSTQEVGNPIHLRDARTGAELRLLRGHEQPPVDLVLSRDSKTLASVSRDGSILLWKTDTGTQLHKLRLTHPPVRPLTPFLSNQMTFSPDGKVFAACDGARIVKLWDVQTGEEKATLEALAKGTIEAVEFSPDGKSLAVKGTESLALWDLTTRKLLRQWPVLSTSISPLRFSPDGKILAATRAGNVLMWDTHSGKLLHEWPGLRSYTTWTGASSDGKTLLSAARLDGQILSWDMNTARLRQELPLEKGGFLGIERSADGRYVALSHGDGTLKVRQLPDGKEVRRLVVEAPSTDLAKPFIRALNLSSDGAHLAAIARRYEARNRFSSSLFVWDVASGKLLVKRRLPVDANDVYFQFAPDGQTLAIPRERDFLLQDVTTGQERLTLTGHLGVPVGLSADGFVLAAAIYKPRDLGNRPRLSRQREEIEAVGLWELATGQLIGRLKTGPVAQLAFAPGGRILATAGTDALILWDIATGKAVLRRPLEPVNMGIQISAVQSLDFTPDGRFLPTGMVDGTLLVWDVAAATHPSQQPRTLEQQELDKAWTDLGGEAAAAWPAIGRLTEAGSQTLALFRKRLQPAKDVPAERLRRLLMDLNSSEFTVRDTASHELEKLGDLAEPALRRALEDKPSLEVRQRIETLLSALRLVHQPEVLRRLRAVCVLEQIDTPEAQKMLEMLSKGSSAARETAAAKAALARCRRQTQK